jgi:hypothetical protein
VNNVVAAKTIFETKEQLQKFSELASKQDFNVYLSTSYCQLDARSLLSLFTTLGKEVTIVASDHANVDDFFKFVEKWKKEANRI